MSTERRRAELTPRIYVSHRGRPGVGSVPGEGSGSGSGCLGSLMMGFVYLLGVIIFVGAVVLIIGVFAAAMLIALIALGVNRVLLALSPKWRERRDAQGHFQPVGQVFTTTARVIDSSKPKRR